VTRLAAAGMLLVVAPSLHLGSSGPSSAAAKEGAGVAVASPLATPTASSTAAPSPSPTPAVSAASTPVQTPATGVAAALKVEGFPVDHELYPRAQIGDRLVPITVTVRSSSTDVTSLTLTVSSPGGPTRTRTLPVSRGRTVQLMAKLPVALRSSSVALTARTPQGTAVVARAGDVVAGDLYVVNGQSNAEAAAFPAEDAVAQADAANPWVRTVGGGWDTTAPSVADRGWYVASAGGGRNSSGSVGKWELRMADLLVRRHHVPVAVVNGAHSGEAISWFGPDHVQPGDPGNNYRRLMGRLNAYDLAGSVRSVIFYQGESDAHSMAEARHWTAKFDDLLAAWHESFPRLAHVYVTQVRGCPGSPAAAVKRIRAEQLALESLPGVHVVSTDSMQGQDGCHFHYEGGYRALGTTYAGLIDRDTYAAR
jgi:hypothetical protein